jgi:hypothetical protein
MALLNEIAVSLYLYLMMLLTDPMSPAAAASPPQGRETLGWALTILISLTVLFNILKAL